MNLVFLHDQNVKAKIQISWDRNKLLRSDKKHISSFLRGIIEVKKILLELFFLTKKRLYRSRLHFSWTFPATFELQIFNFNFIIIFNTSKWYFWKRIFKLDIFKIVEVSKTDFSRRFNRRKRRSYSEPIQGSKMVRFVKTFSWNSLTIFAKSSMLDVWLRSECASDFSSDRSSF